MEYAASYLKSSGFCVVDTPKPDVTHLLLSVPSFPNGDNYLEPLLRQLPETITISGGNLAHTLLKKYKSTDFLQDPQYLLANASITAVCAAKLPKLDYTGVPVLILGWGRIGKHLAELLRQQGADVTVSVRNPLDLGKIQALGMSAVSIENVRNTLENFRVIFNTVPAMILPNLICRPDCLIYELASTPGMSGENIISARGLPGKYAPEDSGKLIAKTFIRLVLQKEADL